MAFNDPVEQLRQVRVKLYPNYLPKVEGAYIAKTDNEKTLSIEDVCAASKLRGGFTGSYEDMVEHANIFHNEMAYHLCGGFVSTGYYSIHPNAGSTFDKLREGVTPEKHPVDFRFHFGDGAVYRGERGIGQLRRCRDQGRVERHAKPAVVRGCRDGKGQMPETLRRRDEQGRKGNQRPCRPHRRGRL